MKVTSSSVHVGTAKNLLASICSNHRIAYKPCLRTIKQPSTLSSYHKEVYGILHRRGLAIQSFKSFANPLTVLTGAKARTSPRVHGNIDHTATFWKVPRFRMEAADKKHVRAKEWSPEGIEELKQRLRAYKAQQLSSLEQKTPNPDSAGLEEGKKPSKKASVLVLLFQGPRNELRVLLTERSKGLSSHSGRGCGLPSMSDRLSPLTSVHYRRLTYVGRLNVPQRSGVVDQIWLQTACYVSLLQRGSLPHQVSLVLAVACR